MKGLDTNVLVRYLVQDDPKQNRWASHFIETECTIEKPAFINSIVLCELVWVLETAYGYPKENIVIVIDKILRTKQFFVYQSDIVLKSLHSYQKEGADFADNYIAHFNALKGCQFTVTFDKKASRVNGFQLLKDSRSM